MNSSAGSDEADTAASARRFLQEAARLAAVENTPEETYRAAPTIEQETAALAELSLTWFVPTPGGEDGTDQERERTYLLRRAALADRTALDLGIEESVRDAEGLADRLLAYDRENPHGASVPQAPTTHRGSAREYVRQEYSSLGW